MKERLPSTGPTDAPTVVFLATDGQPNDFCSNGAAGVVADNVIAQVKQLAQSGVIVHPISLAGGDADLTRHLTDIATASGTGHAVLVPENAAELNGMIRGVFGSLASCETLLTSHIAPGAECGISVQLNGETLDCNSDNGWRLSAERDTIVLTGTVATRTIRTSRRASTPSTPARSSSNHKAR